MSLVKGMLLGAILTLVMSLIIGSQGSEGGFLYIFPVDVPLSKIHQVDWQDFAFYWSWPLFIAGSVLATAILVMLD